MITEADLSVAPFGRLKAKLVVFEKHKDLSSFWRKVLRKKMSSQKVCGCVQLLGSVSQTHNGVGWVDHITFVDPRYFCLIGLIKGYLGSEVVSHESVHAGFAYAKRVKRNIFAPLDSLDEEAVAYPSGIIACEIIKHLYKVGLY